MVDLGSLAGLFRRQHELHAYCLRCDRWRVLDLAALVEAGQGERRLPLCVRCRVCGEQGRVQVRPPAPTRSSSGWIAPPVIPSA
jgi:RNase P subunit RPR2